MAIRRQPEGNKLIKDSTWGFANLSLGDLESTNKEREEGIAGCLYRPLEDYNPDLIDSAEHDSPGPHSASTSPEPSSLNASDDESMAALALADSSVFGKSSGGLFGPRMATPPTDMAAQDPLRAAAPNLHTKRKFLNDTGDSSPKKRRATGSPQPDIHAHSRTPASPLSALRSSYAQIHEQILPKLDVTYAVKTMSVMSSTSINKHVDAALAHLGRFDALDMSVLPGVVLLSAKAGAAGKLITISEVVRRRISESKQKWFQYNLLNTMVTDGAPQQEPSVVEDTYMAEVADDEDEYFETRQPTIHEQAVQPARLKHTTYLSVLLSRVPLDELTADSSVSVQTNEPYIKELRKEMGLVE